MSERVMGTHMTILRVQSKACAPHAPVCLDDELLKRRQVRHLVPLQHRRCSNARRTAELARVQHCIHVNIGRVGHPTSSRHI
jgi:hypothetical protein